MNQNPIRLTNTFHKLSQKCLPIIHILLITSFIFSAAVPVSSVAAFSNQPKDIKQNTLTLKEATSFKPHKPVEFHNDAAKNNISPILDKSLVDTPHTFYILSYQVSVTKPYYDDNNTISTENRRSGSVILPSEHQVGIAVKARKENANPTGQNHWCYFAEVGWDQDLVPKLFGISFDSSIPGINDFVTQNFPDFPQAAIPNINDKPLYAYWEGFGVGSHDCVYEIWGIYDGTPPEIKDQSTLSSNQPKNGAGDPRECSLNGCSGAQAKAGDPIDTRTGNFDYSMVDLSLQTIAGPLSFQRSYASLATDLNIYPTDLGPGWTHNQDIRLMIEPGLVWVKAHTQNQYQFKDNGDQTFTPYPGVLASLRLANSTYSLKASDQSIYTFDQEGRVLTWRNENGYGFDYSYTAGKLNRVTEPVSERYLEFGYQDNHLKSVSDGSRSVSFNYDNNGDLISFTDARTKTWGYEYDGLSHRLKTIKDPSTLAKTILSIHYDEQGRADEQYNGKGERLVKIIYNLDGTRLIYDALGRQSTDGYDGRNTIAISTDASGYTLQKSFDENFRISEIIANGSRTAHYKWSADGAALTSIQDPEGYQTNLKYDAQHHLVQVTDPRSQITNFTYFGSLLTSSTRQTTSGNVVTTYTYTTSADAPQPVGLLKTVTDPLLHTTTFIYDTAGQLITIRDANNKETHFAYDAIGRVTDMTNPLGRVTRYAYDPAGNIMQVTENYDLVHQPNEQSIYNRSTTYTYDDQGRLYQTKNPLGFTTTYSYDDAGRVYQVFDTYNKATTYTYNAAGQVSAVTDPMGHSTSYEFDSAGRLWKVKDALNRVVLTYTYNADSTVQSETRPTAAGDYITSYQYDALQRVKTVQDNLGHYWATEYDAYGNIGKRTVKRADNVNLVTSYEYNDLGLLSAVVENYQQTPPPNADPNSTNVRTEFTYDNAGNLKTIKDANNHVTSYDYDNLNRLWKVTDPRLKVTEYGYDDLGNRTSLKDNIGNTTYFNYDLASRLHSINYPGGVAEETIFGYDASGRLTGMDDQLGHTTWVYDNLNRITSITDPLNKSIGYGYDDDSKRTQITYPAPVNKTITYQYSTLDQLEHVLNGTAHLADYTYDIASRLSGNTLGNGITASYGYDVSGQLRTLTYQKGTEQRSSYTYQYDLAGNRTQVDESVYYPRFLYLPIVLNQGGTSGQVQSLQSGLDNSESVPNAVPLDGYPAPMDGAPTDGEMNSLNSNPSGNEGLDNPYPAPEAPSSSGETSFLQKAWDFLVNLFTDHTPVVSAHSDFAQGYPAPGTGGIVLNQAGPTISYGYDGLNRLTSAVYSDGKSYSYTYDKVGNRTSQTINGAATTYQYDAADRMISAGGTSLSWDDNGNLLNDGSTAFTYDSANRLKTATKGQNSYTFTYDGLGNRYRQSLNGLSTNYTLDLAAGLSQVLYDGSSTYYYGLERIAQERNSTTEYFLSDALGSVRQIANAGGAVTLGQSFDPFGNPASRSGIGSSSYGFAGEWTDGTGLQSLRARYYSPAQGRFLTRDPFQGFLSQPASLNAYAYAANNPILMADPSGRIVPLLAIAGLGFIAGAAYNAYQQTDGFSNWCHFDVMQSLAWGAGGAAAATSIAILSVGLVGMAGMGLQGAAFTLYSLGFSGSAVTGLWTGGMAVSGASAMAAAWLLGSQSQSALIPQTGSSGNIARVRHYSQAIEQIRQDMVIKSESRYVWTEYPIQTANEENAIQQTTKEFFRPLNGRGGFVEFNVDTTKWNILPDPNLPGLSNSKVIDLATNSNPYYIVNIGGFPLYESGVDPIFYDWMGRLLR